MKETDAGVATILRLVKSIPNSCYVARISAALFSAA